MNNHRAEIYYYDIGDYLSREQKLDIITKFKSMENLPFTRITPNEHGDWISQRNDQFSTWIPIEVDKKFNSASQSFFTIHSLGVNTNRDVWVYGFSKKQTSVKMQNTISFYNQQVKDLGVARKENTKLSADEFKNNDSRKISWCSSLVPKLNTLTKCNFQEDSIVLGNYRPFVKEYLYFGELFIHRRGQFDKIFPTPKHKNLVICVNGLGGNKEPSVLISDCIVDLNSQEAGAQCFPLYWYETIEPKQHSLFDDGAKIVRHEAISGFILNRAQQKYGNKVEREDIFYYVYGILHSKSYRETFSADLKKMLPRIPLISDWQKFWAFSKAGRQLADLHVNYEEVERYPDIEISSLKYIQYGTGMQNTYNDGLIAAERTPQVIPQSETDYHYYAVEQMKFPKKGEKGTILYNHWHTIKNIPEKAYEYVVNGKSAIEWIMERYAVTTDKKSGIKNDPNDWPREHKKPRAIFDLLLSIINVSVQTVDIVNGLPEVDWDKE